MTTQISKVIGIMSISNNWEEFKRNFNRMVDRANGQTELNFKEEPKQTSFDKNLKKALNFNPKDNLNEDNQVYLNFE